MSDVGKVKAITVSTPGANIDGVVVHPLVLLGVVDHYNRVAKDARNRRVVGVLLGETYKGRVDVTNSFALPFEEDQKDPGIFYLDHLYLESMFNMHKKIAAKERIIGFYSTGPQIRPADLKIDALFRDYHPNPVLVIVDVRLNVEGLPIQSYQTVETVQDGKEAVRTFVHIPSEVGAYEAEEVGVEHLLRDINDPTASHLAGDLRAKLGGLRGLTSRLREMATYLEAVVAGKLPKNHEILYHIQALLNMLPNTQVEDVKRSMFETTNDQHMILYISSLVRAVLGLHDLVNNKTKHRDTEEGTTAVNTTPATESTASAADDKEKKSEAKGASK